MASTRPWEGQVSDILQLVQQCNVTIDESQTITLRTFIEEHHDDRDKFISQILTARYDNEDSLLNGQLSSDILDVILYRFIKVTELNCDNIAHIASVIINEFNKAEEIHVDEVYDILVQNDICGRSFVRGTDEYINAAKFCNLFKSVSNWKKNKSVFRKMWVRINKWEDTEIRGGEPESENTADVTATSLNTTMMAEATGLSLNNMIEIVKENGIHIDDVQIDQINSILVKCNQDRNRFISQLVHSYFRPNSTTSNAGISKDIAAIILYKCIKNTDLNTNNVIDMASMIIPKLNKGDTVDIEAVSDILHKNKVNGNVFAKGTSEYLNSAKFSRLFKPLSNWKDTKGVYSKFWKQMSRWEMMKTATSSKTQSGKSPENDVVMLTEMLKTDYRDAVHIEMQSKSVEMSEMHSKGLVDEHKDDESYPDEAECKYSFEECPQCQRTKDALLEFQRMIDSDPHAEADGDLGILQSESHEKTLCNIFNDQYDVVDLLNDFHHLREAHSVDDDGDPNQFEMCHEFLTNVEPSVKCQSANCQAMRRQYRRRRGDDGRTKEDYRESILLQIHCFLVHSMDVTKLTRNERMVVEVQSNSDRREQKISEFMKKKSQNIKDIIGDTTNYKFVLNMNDNEEMKEETDDDINESSALPQSQNYEYLGRDDAQILCEFQRITGCNEEVAAAFLRDSEWNPAIAIHRFYEHGLVDIDDERRLNDDASDFKQNNDIYTEGVRFWYWSDHTRPRNAVTVRPKYRNLKEEMVTAGHLSIGMWNDLVTLCERLLKARWLKKVKASGNGHLIYGIEAGAVFALKWLLALKLYTDFDDLNHTFCDQFRLRVFSGNSMETMRSIITRNGRYFNMAKQLTECVQCFGQMMVGKKKRYYRGVKRAFVFSRFISRFHVPLSTSKSKHVAAAFAESGIVIAFGKFEAPIPCMDAEWLSCHQHEKEVLFFGGDSILQIRGILKIERGGWATYTKQIEAIQAIRSLANGSLIADGISRRTKNEIYRMINAISNRNLENTIQSPYIRELLVYQINNTPTRLTFDWSIISTEWRFLGDILLRNQNHRIPHVLNIFNLFPRIQCIVFLMPDMFALQTFHWNSMMQDLKGKHMAMTLIFQWESDVGDVIEESFEYLNQVNDGLVQNTNVEATRESLSIQLQITVSGPSAPPPSPVVVKQDEPMDGHATNPRSSTSIFNYRPSSSRSYPSRKCPTICLDICQYDWVSPLTIEERMESLVHGYARELCAGTLPDVIVSACFKYTGDATEFVNEDALMSLTESGLNCCGSATKWGSCRSKVKEISVDCCVGFAYCCGGFGLCCLALLIPFSFLGKFAVDILSLIMACTHDVGETTVYLSPLDVTTWLFVASIVDLMMICSGCTVACLYARSEYKLSEIRNEVFGSSCCLELLLTLFYSVWIAFGITLMQQVGDIQVVAAVMLSWCIIQGFTSVVVPLCLRVAQNVVADKDKILLCPDIAVFGAFCLRFGGIAADIAALIIASDYDCNNATFNSASSLGSLDANSWIFVGAITDMIIPFIFFLPIINIMEEDTHDYICLFMAATLFDILWSVFGFILYAELDPEHSCSQMVLY